MNTYRNLTIGIVLIVAVLGAFAYFQSDYADAKHSRAVVAEFGDVLKNVPLTAEADIASAAIEEHYARYITADLLEQWKEDPASAPGRETSSPWPERIEVTSAEPQGEGYVVTGDIVLMTSAEVTGGGDAGRTPIISLVIPSDDGWRIAAFQEQRTGEDS